MAEALGVSETVTVEVVRASPSLNLPANFPLDYTFVAIGIIVAIVLIAFGVNRYMKSGGGRYVRKTGSYGGQSGSGKGRLWKSVVIAAVFGFAAFMLSGDTLSWLLSAGIFYYEFAVRRRN